MKFELFISRRLKLGSSEGTASPSLNVALAGIVLAIVIMILSIVIVMGFKREVTGKIYSLDAHVKVNNAVLGIDDNLSTVNFAEVKQAIAAHRELEPQISSMSLIAEKPAILKTDNDFKGIMLRGVDHNFDLTFIKNHLVEGRLINFSDSVTGKEILISKTISDQLGLKPGDKILTYFIDNKVKVRNEVVAGIFNTDFDHFDKGYILSDISLVQQVNGWNMDRGNYVGININDAENSEDFAYKTFGALAQWVYENNTSTLFNVTHTKSNNMQFFAWLGMLDMNVVIILVLMMIVSGFTLISALLMIVLERIKMVGMLKALGASNRSIRNIFIYLTQKLIFKSLIIGNLVGIGLALIQKYFHVVRLDAETYYMPYVPIHIDVPTLLLLNVGIIVISYLTLLGPSYIISTIKPTTTMRFE